MTERPPEGLREHGRALWRDVLADVADGWRLDARERHLLVRACRCADELHELEQAVDADGVVIAGSRGQQTVHFASLMIAAGVNAKALSTYMGHANIAITMDRYGHLMPGNENQAAGLLDAYLASAHS